MRNKREFGPWMLASIKARSQHGSSISRPFESAYLTFSNMKIGIVLLAVLAYATAQKYTTKYDNIDLDSILNSRRLLGNYVNCLLDLGSCTPDGKELKMILPDALEHGCKDCNEKQRMGSEKVIWFLVNKRSDLWTKLSEKYDPNNVYKAKFEGEAKKIGVKL